MTVASPSPRVRRVWPAMAATALTWLASIGLLVMLGGMVVAQVLNPPPAKRVLLQEDIPLPSAYIPLAAHQDAPDPSQQNSLAPGTTQQFDHFDFQALDPHTHLLFIAHTGAATDSLTAADIKVDADLDGHIIVFNTQQNKLVGRINVPHITGVVVAPDLHKVFANNGDDNIVYDIDETTLNVVPIPLAENAFPDGISYDQPDHRIFVSDPGLTPDVQDVTIIDARTDKVITRVNLGKLPVLPQENKVVTDAHITVNAPGDRPEFGYDVGHNKYDPVSRRVYVTTQILASSPITVLAPPDPNGAGELMEIDPLTAKVVQRLVLPMTCGSPHGLALDTQQEIAFVACTDLDPDRNLIANLLRVDLKTMKVIPANVQTMRLEVGADLVVLDTAAQVVFVGCKSVISVFSNQPGNFHLLGEYLVGKGTHTLAVDEATQLIYLPLVEVGGRPTLRIVKYNPNGT